ncbi:glycosyltransferase family 2 protein [Lacrimispora xylanisolvens]|uniref:glycosyltransferase family 2 protein n=1 Tax=Lacrimispora xylanisolvens TaxID=384636 RepID=UPI0024029359
MNVSCIILNYNDADTTIKLVQGMKDYSSLDSIVVVDNHSTDDSAARLKDLDGGRVHVVGSLKTVGMVMEIIWESVMLTGSLALPTY